MTRAHSHVFAEYVGISVFGGTGTAWVDRRFVDDAPDDQLTMWRCVICGEQGYEVR